MLTVTSAARAGKTCRTACSIIRRGTGLIAASPTGSFMPGRVIVPTPSPARKRMPPSLSISRTRARTSLPVVISGSSPPSLMTPQT